VSGTTSTVFNRLRPGKVATGSATGLDIDEPAIEMGGTVEIGPPIVPVAVSVISSVGFTSTDQAAHVLVAGARAAAGVAPVGTARKSAPAAVSAAAGVAPASAARKVVPALARAAVGAAASGTARKLAVATGRAAVGVAATSSLAAVVVRAVVVRVSAGFAAVGTARKRSLVGGASAAGITARVSVVKRATAAGRTYLGIVASRTAVLTQRPGAILPGVRRGPGISAGTRVGANIEPSALPPTPSPGSGLPASLPFTIGS
jgi:hypothetical protein